MLKYEHLQPRPRDFLALTGHTVEEFTVLLPAFEAAYAQHHPAHLTARGKARVRRTGAGLKGQLPRSCDKLLFILVYLKTNPLQTAHGLHSGMGQSGANFWIHRLLPILQDALQRLGHTPQRPAADGAAKAAGADGAATAAGADGAAKAAGAHGAVPPQHPAPHPLLTAGGANLLIDGTERRRQRPQDHARQKAHYSGKKKTHTDKNLLVVNATSGKVAYLSQSVPGQQHDKKMADAVAIPYPPGATLGKDTGFQGYEPAGVFTFQPKKSLAAEP